MAALYRDADRRQPDSHPIPSELPGLGSFTDSQRTELGLRQIQSGLHRLSDRISAAGLTLPQTGPFRDAFEGRPDPARGRLAELRGRLLELHVEILETFTAVDFRLGKAYGLGRGLADTAEVADRDALNEQFDRGRAYQLDVWLADLDSALPAHASSSVRMSLKGWEDWVRQPKLDGEPLDWARDRDEVRGSLHRQGQRWRALLSGEKAGRDMLKSKDYLRAIQVLMGRAGGLILAFSFTFGSWSSWLWA